jgi:hypothetical protein
MRSLAFALSSVLAWASLSACGSGDLPGGGAGSPTGTGGAGAGPSAGTGGAGGTPVVGAGAGGATTGTGGSPPIDTPDAATTSDAAADVAVFDAARTRDAAVPRDAAIRDAAPVIVGDAGGAAYKGVANSACADLVTIGASWYYNWTTSPGNCKNSQFVPMVWGHTGNEQSATGVANEVDGLVTAGYRYLLGFNEPDNSGQANITVANAVALWPSFNNPGAILGSPATQANTTGLAWFSAASPPSFMTQVNADTTGNLRVDFIDAHWYGWNAGSCEPNAATFEAYLRQIEAVPGNRPIWITEFGCLNLSAPTVDVIQSFLRGAITMLAKHPRVARYAWYPWATNHNLVDTTGALTALGEIFAAAPATK